MQKASIRDWSVVKFMGDYVLSGQVQGHPRQNEFHMDVVQFTSPLVSIDFAEGVAVTRNTEYKLLED